MASTSLNELKRRIWSMENTHHLTRAMEMVARSKLHQAQASLAACQDYFEALTRAMTAISRSNRDFSSPFVRSPAGKGSCLVVVAGDRGLAGGYYPNLFALVQETMAQPGRVAVPLGKKAVDFLHRQGFQTRSDRYASPSALTPEDCLELGRRLCQDFQRGEFDRVGLIYTRYVSPLAQKPRCHWLLPFSPPEGEADRPGRGLIQYEPNAETVFDAICPAYLGGMIYGGVCHGAISEFAARRNAMHNASQNAEDRIAQLRLEYNRGRQSIITQELTELIAGRSESREEERSWIPWPKQPPVMSSPF